jgi:hypothetical protein
MIELAKAQVKAANDASTELTKTILEEMGFAGAEWANV